MENINVNVTVGDLTAIVKETLSASITKSLAVNKDQIETSINGYFKNSFFNNKETQFESALDWAVENAFRIGLEQAMSEMGFKELIATKAKEILSSNDFIAALAEKKVRASLGLA